MVFAIFKDRRFTSWTPKNQIKAAISNTPINYNDWLICKLNCLEIDTSVFKSKIIYVKILYKESDVEDQNDRTYVFEIEDGDLSKVSVNISGEFLDFLEIETGDLVCNCDD